MSEIKLYNMTMVRNKDGRVLVLDRIKNDWGGLTFPGGKVEPGESFVASAIREIYEETGLRIENPIPCGVVHWAHKESGRRYIEYLYRAETFTGTPIEGTDEGKIFWMETEELLSSDRLSANFDLYLPLFLEDGYSELYFDWDGTSWNAVPEYFRYETQKADID